MYCECGCGQKTKIAPWDDPRYQQVKGEPKRFINGHNRRKTTGQRYVVLDSGCWEWQGARNNVGYGTTWDGTKARSAHRFAYELRHGAIPEGLVIDHLCRNRACVNPDHMEPVTQQVNVQRGFAARAA